MYIIYASTWDEKIPKNVYGFVIAGYYAAINIAFGKISGGSMNPARVVGPAVFSGYFGTLWVYTLGPLVGCSLGCLFYKSVMLESNKKLEETVQQPNLVMLEPVDFSEDAIL